MGNRNIENIWVHQVSNYGLGNFINLTPTIRCMAEYFNTPVPVYFDMEFVRQCFLDCEFIKIIDKRPSRAPLFSSGLVNFKNNCPDYLHAYREVIKVFPLGEMGHTYVDVPDMDVPVYDILFIRGSGVEDRFYITMKTPDNAYYEGYFKSQYTMGFTGSEGDLERAGDLFNGCHLHIGNIRESLALISKAKFIVANDSGLAHAAGAMNKTMDLLWKNTSLPKNANPGLYSKYKMCH